MVNHRSPLKHLSPKVDLNGRVDGDQVIYDIEIGISPVELANSPKTTSLTSTHIKLSGLAANQNYSGRVVAIDAEGGQSTSKFDFVTTSRD